MKSLAWIGVLCLAAGPSRDAKEDVAAAIKKLAEAPNYSWTVETKNNNPDGGGAPGRGQMGPMEGKAEKEGMSWISTKVGEIPIEGIVKGDKFALKMADGWMGASELESVGQQGGFDPSRFASRFLKGLKPPVEAMTQTLGRLGELKAEADGLYTADFTPEGAKEALTQRSGGNAPTASEAKGSVKIWIKDGVVSKLESTMSGKLTFGEREISFNRTSTMTLKDVGTTKIEVPDKAKKKLE